MATRKEEITSGCLSKVAEDEPVFIIRAADKCAPYMVQVWTSFAMMMGADPEKIIGAFKIGADMQQWQNKNPDKVKVPD